MLSLYKLEIFAAVVQSGSFSAAAQRLYMSQPAVSQHIQELERGLGTALFLRGRRGVSLTPSGETLYDYTQRILHLVLEAESEVTNVENLSEGQISIGATPGVSTYLLPDWLRGFGDKYPQLNVALQTGITTQNIAGVMEQMLDVSFVEGELEKIQRKGLGSLFLRPVSMLIVISCEHRWCGRASVTMDMLHDEPFITRQVGSRTRVWTDEILEAHSIKPRIVGEYDNQEAIKQAVMNNMGVAIMPDYAVERERAVNLLNTLSIENVELRREIKLLWDTNKPFSPVTRVLLLYLMERFPQLSQLVQK